jgi:hypothetical protein
MSQGLVGQISCDKRPNHRASAQSCSSLHALAFGFVVRVSSPVRFPCMSKPPILTCNTPAGTMTALTDHAAGFHREKNLEPRELRVGVEERSDQWDRDDCDGSHVALLVRRDDAADCPANGHSDDEHADHQSGFHHFSPVELTPAFTCAAGSVAPVEGRLNSGECRAWCGIVVIRRPLKLRIWRW